MLDVRERVSVSARGHDGSRMAYATPALCFQVKLPGACQEFHAGAAPEYDQPSETKIPIHDKSRSASVLCMCESLDSGLCKCSAVYLSSTTQAAWNARLRGRSLPSICASEQVILGSPVASETKQCFSNRQYLRHGPRQGTALRSRIVVGVVHWWLFLGDPPLSPLGHLKACFWMLSNSKTLTVINDVDFQHRGLSPAALGLMPACAQATKCSLSGCQQSPPSATSEAPP